MGQVNGWARVTQLIVAESERFQVHRPLVPMTFSLHDASFKNGKDVRICKLTHLATQSSDGVQLASVMLR